MESGSRGGGHVRVEWAVDVTPSVVRWVDAVWDAAWDAVNAAALSLPVPRGAVPPLLGRGQRDELLDVLASPALPAPRAIPPPASAVDSDGREQTVDEWAFRQALSSVDPDGVPLAAVLKALVVAGLALVDHDGGLSPVVTVAVETLHARTGRPDLLTLARYLADLGVGPGTVTLTWSGAYEWRCPGRAWPDEDVVPLLAHEVGWLVEALRRRGDHGWGHDRSRLFLAAGKLPDPPAELDDVLLALALGTARRDRALAQHALADRRGLDDRLLAALGDRRSAVRAVAAEWLGRRGHAAAAGSLRRALGVERNDVARAALLGALEVLGEDVDLDARADLTTRAEREATRRPPDAVDRLALQEVPPVRWSDDGDPVPQAVLRHLVAQAVRGRSPEPDAMLRRAVAALDARDRPALGAAVLDAWLRAGEQGAALPARGILALAAACGGPQVVEAARAVLEKDDGPAPATGRALVAMLGRTDEPGAVQVLLEVRRRSRTRAVQEEAARQLDALAERGRLTLSGD